MVRGFLILRAVAIFHLLLNWKCLALRAYLGNLGVPIPGQMHNRQVRTPLALRAWQRTATGGPISRRRVISVIFWERDCSF
jgi:hypothetical protein